jgi:DnaJ-class molecular chaperone
MTQHDTIQVVCPDCGGQQVTDGGQVCPGCLGQGHIAVDRVAYGAGVPEGYREWVGNRFHGVR